MANVITAIINLVEDTELQLGNYYNQRHRANGEGDALEEYVKDIFSGTLRLENDEERNAIISRTFSYLGNDSNPPDAILAGGDAIEVKKLESACGSIQLNSSHPKFKLLSSSGMISNECKSADGGEWTEKDILYIIGQVTEKQLKSMFMVYGVDYAASEQTYLNIKNALKAGIEAIQGVSFSETEELGRLNKIDPLEITCLRIRAMWIIQNPWKAFEYVSKFDKNKRFNFCAIISNDKYYSFSEHDILEQLSQRNTKLTISDVSIKDVNSPVDMKQAKMIKYVI